MKIRVRERTCARYSVFAPANDWVPKTVPSTLSVCCCQDAYDEGDHGKEEAVDPYANLSKKEKKKKKKQVKTLGFVWLSSPLNHGQIFSGL